MKLVRKIICSVCGHRVYPFRTNVYQAYDRDRIYDCMDCDVCGCQVPLKIRMSKVKKQDGEK